MTDPIDLDDLTEPADESAACADARCGHWVALGPPPGSGGTDMALFGTVLNAFPEGTLIVGGPSVPAAITVPQGCWLLHAPHHDWEEGQ